MRLLGLSALVPLLAACHNETSDLYAKSPSQADSGTPARKPDAGTTRAPDRTPYETALAVYGAEPSCLACVERSCGKPAHACAEDEGCAADAACRVDCDGNPYCEWECKLAQPKADRPTFPLEDCIIASCVEACRVGEQFDCVGKYAPMADADETIVQFWQLFLGLNNAPFPEGIRAQVCPIGDLECRAPVFTTFSDADGAFRLEWPRPTERFGSLLPFEGYLELTDPQNPPRIMPTLVVDNLGPTANSIEWPYEMTVSTPEEAALIASLFDIVYDPDQGSVSGLPYDCRASERVRGVGVTFEVTPASPMTQYFYGIDRTAKASLPDPMFSGGLAHPVPPGLATWTAVHDDDEVARVSRVPVRADARTIVSTLPK